MTAWNRKCIAPASSARVDIATPSNATFYDSFQFDPPPTGLTGTTGVTGPQWNFSNKTFRLDIAANHETNVPLLTLTPAAGEIVVDDVTNRILHFLVDDAVLGAALIPGDYVYDFVMLDNSDPPVRVVLMHGKFTVTDGVTGG